MKRLPAIPQPLIATCQAMESRRFFAITATLGLDQLLRITGTEAGEQVIVSTGGSGEIIVTEIGAPPVAFPGDGVRRIVADLFAGNDAIQINTALPSTLKGGAGEDLLVGGEGDDVLDGGAGNDTLNGRGGADAVDYSARTQPVTAALRFDVDSGLLAGGGGVAGEADAYHFVERLIGGSGADTLDAYAGEDATPGGDYFLEVLGGPGDDRISARFGGFAGNGNVRLIVRGGAGNDVFEYRFIAQFNQPEFFGEDGNDLMVVTEISGLAFAFDGGADVDLLSVDASGDTIHLGPGVENFSGGAGYIYGNELDNDIIVGSSMSGTALVDAGDGDDIVRYGEGTVLGGNGNDTLLGDNGFEPLTVFDGGPGRDVLYGGGGPDHLLGGDGDDWLIADADGDLDTLDGGGGFDRVLTLSSDGNDVLLNVERIMPARLSRLAVDVLLPDLSRRYRAR